MYGEALPCDEMDSAGDAERTEEADEWRECERPRDGGKSDPSSAVIEFRKSVLAQYVST